MVRTSIGCRAPATQRNRMEAVSENEALVLRVVLRSLQNDPSQAAAVVLGGDSRRASAHRRAAPGGAPWSAGRRRCTNQLRHPRRTSLQLRRVRTHPPGSHRAPAGCAAPAAPQAVAWAAPLAQACRAHAWCRDRGGRKPRPCRPPGQAPAHSAGNGLNCARSAPGPCRHAAAACDRGCTRRRRPQRQAADRHPGGAAPRLHGQAARPDARHAHPGPGLPADASPSDAQHRGGAHGGASQAGNRDGGADTPRPVPAYPGTARRGRRQSDTSARGGAVRP
mmetsp:Transcript_42341/g.99576  ORF Transcript_42341/g.99576 Transcript_42341/m.99576 type:complete len:279 (+) Transcript_42341:303-1139(+)